MHAGIVGTGPAAEAFRAACADVDATVSDTNPADLGDVDFGAVVAPAGAAAFDAADDAAGRWVAVEIGGLGGHAVPDLDAAVSVFDADSAGYADLRARMAATRDGPGEASATGDRSAVRLAGAVAGRRMVALLAGADVGGTVVEVPGDERAFLPVPDSSDRDRTLRRDYRDVSLDDSLERAERGFDERVGLLDQVGERESFPVPYYLAGTADTTGFSDARAAAFAAGVDVDWDRAFMKALGEGLERYSAGVYRRAEFVVAPEKNRARPVSPREFVRPDTYRPPDVEERVPWVDGEDVQTGETVSLPAEFVHYPPPDERHKPAITTGLGLGNSGVEALLAGLYEVVERDATMLSWYSTYDPLGLAVDDDGFDALVARARAEELSVTPLLVTQDVDVPVVAVAVHREGDWPRFAVGSGADLDAAGAARSALAEALQNWMELRSMGPDAAAEEEGAIGAYADFPDPARAFVDASSRVPAGSVGPDPVPSGEAELAALLDGLDAAGLSAYAARLTPSDVERLGFEAVRALVPAAQPLFTGEPFFGERAEAVPRELGYEPRPDRPFHPYP
ncbi:MAG: YcaO-like family protein [Haloferacaceae archaeon]